MSYAKTPFFSTTPDHAGACPTASNVDSRGRDMVFPPVQAQRMCCAASRRASRRAVFGFQRRHSPLTSHFSLLTVRRAGYPLKRISGKPRTSAPKANRPPASGCSLSFCSDRPIEADVT